MHDGKQWVSDFKQRDLYGGPGYRNNNASYSVYRPQTTGGQARSGPEPPVSCPMNRSI